MDLNFFTDVIIYKLFVQKCFVNYKKEKPRNESWFRLEYVKCSGNYFFNKSLI